VSQRGTPPEAVYTFKHALARDAAHGSLLRSARQHLHAQIAQALEAQSPEMVENHPELLAQHYAEAGLVKKTVSYWEKAGRRSVARSAMAEAAAQYQKGLDQLALLPYSRERQRQELEFRVGLGAALMVVKGFAAPETGHAYAQARMLWEGLGFPSEFLQIPFGQSEYHINRGELHLAQPLAEDLLLLSRQRNDDVGLVLGHYASGRNLMFIGRLASSRSHLEDVLALYHPILHRELVHQTGFDLHVSSGSHLGVLLFCLGYLDQALARSSAAIAEARRLAHPPSLALSLSIGSRLRSLVGGNATLSELASELLSVADEQGFSVYRASGRILQGWVKITNGDVTEGVSLLRCGSNAYRTTGAEAWVPHNIALLATACEIGEEVEEAATLLEDALQMIERTGEHWFAAELYRQRGQLLLRQGQSKAAEELYCKALGLAKEQEAKLWELRATVNLARLRRDQGRPTEARDLLGPVYGWFTEGFDTPDLKEAKTLLDELC
jgi:predicted ATPase